MSGIGIQVHANGLDGLNKALTRMRLLGEKPSPIWHAIGQAGESNTRLRFNNQEGPDGQRWKASQRAIKVGGRTLFRKGHLEGSISYQANNSGAEWGSNMVYAAVHQFGGKIDRLAFSSTLRLRLRPGKGSVLLRQKDHSNLSVFAKATHKLAVERRYTVGAHVITIPARPFLGVNADDAREMLGVASKAVDQAARNKGS